MNPLGLAAMRIYELIDQFIAVLQLDLSCQILTHAGEVPDLTVQFFGPDAALLTANDLEIFLALEALALEIRAPERPELLACSIVAAEDEAKYISGDSCSPKNSDLRTPEDHGRRAESAARGSFIATFSCRPTSRYKDDGIAGWWVILGDNIK